MNEKLIQKQFRMKSVLEKITIIQIKETKRKIQNKFPSCVTECLLTCLSSRLQLIAGSCPNKQRKNHSIWKSMGQSDERDTSFQCFHIWSDSLKSGRMIGFRCGSHSNVLFSLNRLTGRKITVNLTKLRSLLIFSSDLFLSNQLPI